MAKVNKKPTVTPMTEKEIKEWDDLYQYVRGDVMGYDKERPLPRYFTLRLKGLAEGKFMSNNKAKSYGKYGYKAILFTFKISKPKIFQAFSRVVTADEQHKINLIMMIIEREINDVVDRMIKVKEGNKRMENIELPHQENERAEYKAKPKRQNKELDNLW